MKNPIQPKRIRAASILLLAVLTTAQVANAATTNTIGFDTTTVGGNSGPNDPANGPTSINGAGLAVGDVIVFDGIVINVAGTAGDAWAAVNLNQGGFRGLTAASLGVLIRTGSGNPCSLWINGSSAPNFPESTGTRTNRVRIELTATAAGSTDNMNWVVKIDQGLTGAFTTSESGTGVSFADNTINLTFGAQNDAHQFNYNGPAQPPQITTQPQSATLDVGLVAQLTVKAVNSPTGYQWQAGAVSSGVFTNLSDDGQISGATSPTLTITGLTLANTADYQVIVTNPAGSVTSTPPATLTVQAVAPTFVWSAPTPITTADATLNQTGTIVGAEVFGTAEKIVTLTSGAGIAFKADGSVATTTGAGTFGTAFSGDTGNANFNTVLAEANYDGGPKTITLNNLTVGQSYSVQLFALDQRGGGLSSRRASFQDPADPADVSPVFQMGDIVYVTGTFTANSSTMTIQENLLDGNNGNVNALVIRNMSSVIAPQIAAQPQSQATTLGQTAQFIVAAYGSAPLTYQWQKSSVGGSVFTNLVDDGSISGATNSTLTITHLAASDAGDYRVVVSNSYGSDTSAPSATLTIRGIPGIITMDFADISVPNGSQVDGPLATIPGSILQVGDTVVLDLIVVTNGPLTGSGDGWAAVNLGPGGFMGVTSAKLGVLLRLGIGASQMWTNGVGAPNPTSGGAVLNRFRLELYPSVTASTTNMGWKLLIDQNLTGTFLPPVSGSNLTFVNNVIPLGFASYAVDATFTENPRSVSVFTGPSPDSQTVSVGSPVTVGVTVKGWNPAFQWRKNGIPIPNATNRTYTLPSATLADNGAQFDVVVSNLSDPANVVTSAVATVTIRTPNNLTWHPTVDFTTWSTTVNNWTTNGGTTQTRFTAGDNATFDSLGYSIGANSGSTVTLNDAINANGVTVNVINSQSYQWTGSGSLKGQNLHLTGDGTGTLGLQTAASFATAAIDDRSTLDVGSGGVDGSFQANITTNNGTINFNNASGILTIPGRLAGSGSVYQNGSGQTVLSATNSVYSIGSINAGSLAIASVPFGDIANNAELQPSGPLDMVFTNAMSGIGRIYFSGFQKTTLTGVSTYTGINQIYWSEVTVDNPAALGDTSAGASFVSGGERLGGLYLSNNITWVQPLTLGAKVLASAAATIPHLGNRGGNNTVAGPLTFLADGTEFNVDSSAGLLTIASSIVNSAAGANTLNLQGTASGIWNGVLVDGPTAGVDLLNVLKRGTGIWTLNGVNTYGGATTVGNGTLLINGQIAAGVVSVQAGATLGGNGIIGGAVTVAADGTIAPGASIGTLTINNNLTLASGSFTRMKFNKTAATQDQIVGVNTLTYGGTLVISNLSGTLTTSDSFKLFTAAAYAGAFASISPATPATGLAWNTSTLATDGTLRITSGVATNPTDITTAVIGGNTLQLAWPADHIGWTLEAQTNSVSVGLSTNWVRISSSASTNRVSIPIVTTNGCEFFRLVYP